jgi:hypothetical protein
MKIVFVALAFVLLLSKGRRLSLHNSELRTLRIRKLHISQVMNGVFMMHGYMQT